MIKQKQAFTLVELIVVITIVAILGTIAFISLQGYTRDARDSTRISDMTNIKKALDLTYLRLGNYPETTNGQIITFSGTNVWSQGVFGKDTFRKVERLNKIPKDPLLGIEYIYSVTSNRQEFQIAGVMEKDLLSINNTIIGESLAGNDNGYLKIMGQYNGKLISTKTGNLTYILAVPSLITSTGATLEEIIQGNYFSYNGYKNLPFQYKDTNYNILGEGGKKFVNNSDDAVLFKGNIGDLYEKENVELREELVINLQNAYSGTIIANESGINEVLNVDIENLTETNIYSSTIINKSLGGNIKIDTTPIFREPPVDPTLLCVNAGDVLTSSTIYSSCDGADIVMCSGAGTGYVLAGCNVGTSISGTGTNSFGNYYNYPDFRTAVESSICGNGYHVPTNNEWDKVITYWDTNPKGMRDSLNIPIAGYDFPSGLALSFLYGYYWGNIGSSSSYVMHMRKNEGYVYNVIGYYQGANGSYRFPIRCFRDN